MTRGLFIVIYGSNNLGKSKQLDLLERDWLAMGRPYTRLKYPIYDSPTGVLINRALRGDEHGKLELTDEELQTLFAEDRRCFQPRLVELLEEGDVLGEDYTGTGLAWGLTKGVSRELLDEYNAGLLVPDVALLLDGERFGCGIEKGHRHEDGGEGLWQRNREIHLELAKELGWFIVNANRNPETVHGDIMNYISFSQ
ncbi:MAG: Thymidylate kinase [Candidatus Collierbacteria bacterium GW2011_GWF2_44_15]|uniref:Thymidylate kinase n=3 Tax=Candidatus Collieribacteriota TaxID=1752725 RepID=A0A0G1JN33_9BACT|nr:MAG: Thymidylate kinase [Candidatus Collierbacteria bacterium GW2011_GWF1_44_12]KKT45372.1 MAG: Thymidylate kinase [Candidatus Collierbacteria bacterium GW2011_GWF2_44_15]KKU27491.1 MAG: Thymidylate kinase [Candidatus Collierbacteria bacterium GW2011_GWE1_46_18]